MHSPVNNATARGWSICAFLLCLTATYSRPLAQLAAYAASRDLYSHMLLIPFISLYLAYIKRHELHRTEILSSRMAAAAMGLIGGLALLIYVALQHVGTGLNLNDRLALTVFSFLCFLFGGVFLFLGRNIFRVLAFPLLFLLFLAPMPTLVEEAFETGFQIGSAYCYAGLLTLSGTPFFRDGMLFRVPGLTLEVASQCSGIRSSLVLLITGLLAGHLFLRDGWRKLLMAGAFIPIGILRNGARILTITLLTIHVNPEIINGPVHHKGGPPFFVLSLVPLFALLILLRKTEKRTHENDN